MQDDLTKAWAILAKRKGNIKSDVFRLLKKGKSIEQIAVRLNRPMSSIIHIMNFKATGAGRSLNKQLANLRWQR
jgi:hypothetical protein